MSVHVLLLAQLHLVNLPLWHPQINLYHSFNAKLLIFPHMVICRFTRITGRKPSLFYGSLYNLFDIPNVKWATVL